MASSSIVIKVGFGETLRRLNASIHDKKLVLDMVMLKEKIRSLFGFGSDVEFTMTYVDEDGDSVSLADDDDLHDVVRQSLNPLRITVHLKSSNYNGTSGNSTPMRPPQNQLPLQSLNSGVSENFKYIFEPLLEALAKLPFDVASEASSAPAVSELVEKMKAVSSNQILPSIASLMVHPTAGGPPDVGSEPTTVKAQVNSEAGGSNSKKKEKQVQKVAEGVKFREAQPPRGVDLNIPYFEYGSFQAPISSIKSVGQGSTGENKSTTAGVGKEKDYSSEKKEGISSGSLNEPFEHDGLASSQFDELANQRMRRKLIQMNHLSKMRQDTQFDQVAGDINKSTNDSDRSSGWAQGLLNATNQCPFSGMAVRSDSDSQRHHHRSRSPHWKRHYLDNNGMNNVFHRGVTCDGCEAHPITGPRFKSKVKDNYDLCNVCFAGIENATDYIRMDHPTNSFGQHLMSFKRYSVDNNGMGNVFHRGVICDGCGAHPITGPRFKSKVKDDYDLCNVCFAGMGNASDYIRMDHPTNSLRHHLMPFNGSYDSFRHIPTPTRPHSMRAPGSQLSQSQLNSQFILDVNVLDGTIMAPFTAFTKVWRMRNNGSIIWPYGSRLQWIGGDWLSKSHSVDVEIPLDGLDVDKELDIAVDFTAPELPGQYVSYWRMVSPSGQNFGQRVWVLIKVDASMKNLGETSINLNLPPIRSDPEAINQDHLVDNIFSGDNIITNSENTSIDLPPKDHETSFPINDSLIIDNGGVSGTMTTLSAPPGTASSPVFNPTELETALGSLPVGLTVTSGLDTEHISYPTIDFSVMPPIMSSGAALPPTVVVQPSGSGSQVASDDQEQALVKKLEEMGFKHLDLNKKILRKNNYDLEKSIDDLCGVLVWDPMLDELHEMGFADDETNRWLLKKNNGSIKGAVVDLINGEKA